MPTCSWSADGRQVVFEDGEFNCGDTDASVCPGNIATQCESDPVDLADLDPEEDCDCPGQMLLNQDCTGFYHCLSKTPTICPGR